MIRKLNAQCYIFKYIQTKHERYPKLSHLFQSGAKRCNSSILNANQILEF